MKIRERIRTEIIKATARVYGAENYARWQTTKIYPQQIQKTWERAYKELANRHQKMVWLQELMGQHSKDIQLKLVLRIPSKQIEIDLPDKDRKLGAIAHAGGVALLAELLNIITDIGRTNERIQTNESRATGEVISVSQTERRESEISQNNRPQTDNTGTSN